MVFQNYALYPHMTTYGNMSYGLKLRKVLKPVMTKADTIAIRDLRRELKTALNDEEVEQIKSKIATI